MPELDFHSEGANLVKWTETWYCWRFGNLSL